MAEVFLARRRGPGGVEKQLVVKRIAREKSRDPRFGQLFVDEARLSMSLAHKNIVPVFDFGRAGDELFLVMEFVDGIDLGIALRRSRELSLPPSPILVAFIGLEAAQALDYAHTKVDPSGKAQGVVHRDVTPGNVLVSTSGEVKLVDFGVASLADDSLGDGKVRGTPSYMAPEQARGETVDERSDLFSLGLILWEALAGRRAYPGSDPTEVLRLARKRELEPLPDGVPAELRKIIEKATAEDPDQRYASAREMYRALDRYLVSARVDADTDAPPMAQLTQWVSELRPRGKGKPTIEPALIAPVTGEVVTFLAAGPEKVVQTILGEGGDHTAVGEGPGDQTMRSMAATVIEGEDDESSQEAEERQPVAEPIDEPAPVPTAEVSPGRSSLRPWLWGGLGVGVVGAILAVALASSPSTAKLDAAVALAPAFDAGRPLPVADAGSAVAIADIDANPAAAELADAAPVAVARVDAGRPHHRIDAGRKIAGKNLDAGPSTLGIVQVSTSPWAQVSVEGRPESCSETPCKLRLPPGRYRLRMINPVARLGAEIEVAVVADETTTIRQSLTRTLP